MNATPPFFQHSFRTLCCKSSMLVFYLKHCALLKLPRFHQVCFFNSLNAHRPLTLGATESQLLSCLSQRRLLEARRLLDRMSENRSSHIVYWTSLLTKFSKGGFIEEAQVLFDIMPQRNVVTYNSMLSGYLQHGRLGDAIRLFGEMPQKNVVSWTAMLCGLAEMGRICEAKRLFDEMPERNVVSWNAMVVGFIRNEELEDARRTFDSIPVKDVASWNAMITGYVDKGRMQEARALFEKMKDRNAITWTSMISGYCRVGEVEEGFHLFNSARGRNVFTWTAMIGGFAWNGFYKEALLLFLDMERTSDVTPNVETFISLAYACAGLAFHCLGKQLHSQVIVNGLKYDDYDTRLCKSLIYMYSLFGIMDSAHYLFHMYLNNRSVQSCNHLIKGYLRIGHLEKAQSLFDTMPVLDKVSWTSMIDGFFNVGDISKACYLFSNMPGKDAMAWTTMISGHVKNELFSGATFLFSKMLAHGIRPHSTTYTVLFGAAGATAYLDQGRQLHSLVIKTFPESDDLILSNSLISMYAKCGDINAAYRIFSNMLHRDLISWNSMIMGLSHHGLAKEALNMFKAMMESGTRPNSVTFLAILSACAHVGLVIQGWEFFNMMNDVFAIKPGIEHCISMINLLGRAGKLKEAEDFIMGLPFKSNHAIWGVLLGVCSFSERNVDIARNAARRLLEFDPLNAPAHVVLCNVYAASGRHVEEFSLRKEMGLKGVKKTPGCSWVLLNGEVHIFLSGDKLLPQVEEMLSFISSIMLSG